MTDESVTLPGTETPAAEPIDDVGGPPTHEDRAAEMDAQVLDLMAVQMVPPDDPAAYDLGYETGGDDLTPEQMQTDMAVRGWLRDAGIPAGIGTAIATEANRYFDRWERMTEPQRELAPAHTMAELQAIWRDRTDQMVGLARGLVVELDRKHGGAVVEFLETTGLGNCPALIVQLAMHAERRALVARGGR